MPARGDAERAVLRSVAHLLPERVRQVLADECEHADHHLRDIAAGGLPVITRTTVPMRPIDFASDVEATPIVFSISFCWSTGCL